MKPSGMDAALYPKEIERLLDQYFSVFADDRQRLSVLAQQVQSGEPHLCERRTLPGHLTGSALVLRASAAGHSVLLIRHKFLQRWLQPGGHLEPGEHPADGARRELSEEVGSGLRALMHPWHAVSGVPLDIDSHVIPANSHKNEPQHLHHDWMYIFTVAGELDSDLELQLEEVTGFSWVPLSELAGGGYGTRLARAGARLAALAVL